MCLSSKLRVKKSSVHGSERDPIPHLQLQRRLYKYLYGVQWPRLRLTVDSHLSLLWFETLYRFSIVLTLANHSLADPRDSTA